MKSVLFIFVLVLGLTALAGESKYTSVTVENCITLDSSEFDEVEEIDYYEAICRGQKAYVIKVSGGDIRYGVSVLYRGKEISGLTKTTAFHDLGSDKVEWRFTKGAKNPKALIFRINADLAGIGQNGVDLLHVVRLNKMNTCTVAVLKNQKNMNQKARDIADDIENYNCM